MNRARYWQLQESDHEHLTAEESKEWHFCFDWDGLLIHKDDEEFETCCCPGGARIVGVFDASAAAAAPCESPEKK